MAFARAEIEGDPNIGMHVAASEDYAVFPTSVSESTAEMVSDALDVEPLVTTVGGSSLLGALCAMNSNGAVVTRFASEDELEPLEGAELEVCVVKSNMTASGNIVLVNDSAALVHEELDPEWVEELEDALDVPVEQGTVGPYRTVGSAAAVTDEGLLLPGAVREEEAEELEDLFGVPSRTGSVNYGVKMVGAGVVANSKGFVAGSDTTGAEMGRIEEALFPHVA